MAEAELIEQLRAQVMSLKSPRHTTPGHGTNDTESTGSSSRGRITAHTSGGRSGRTSRSNTRVPSSAGVENVDMPVVLDVGGVMYRTTHHTLKCVDGSYFALMLAGMFDIIKTEEGHLFIDRNGELFGYVLEYLRGYVHRDVESIELPSEIKKLRALKREAEFYRLPELASLVTMTIQEQERKESQDDDMNSCSSVIVRDDDALLESEFDIVFHSVASPQCHFTEDRVQELVNRVNHALSIKQADGFKIKSSSSDVIFDPTKNLPFIMFMHVTLCRDKRPGSAFSPTERTKPAGNQFYSSSSSYLQLHPNYDPNSGDALEFVATPRSRHAITPYSPPSEKTYNRGHYQPSSSRDAAPETVFASLEYRTDGQRSHRGNYRPRYGDNIDWDYDSERHRSSSPRNGAGHYKPSSKTAPRKHSGRSEYKRRPEAPSKYKADRVSPDRGVRRDAWVNHAPVN